MKRIGIDFYNKMLCLITEGQHGTEFFDESRDKFIAFIPDEYRNHASYSWDFEEETFAVNKDYHLADGCIMTEDCFIPDKVITMPGLSDKWNDMLKLLGFEEHNLVEEIIDSDPTLAKLLGLL